MSKGNIFGDQSCICIALLVLLVCCVCGGRLF